MLLAGESRGEQGQGAAAAILLVPNGKRFTVSQILSFTTNEEAEYHGLIIGLRKCIQLGIQSIEIKGNSETIFNQVNGLAEVKADKSRFLFREALRLMRQFDRASVEWISAEQNRSARKVVRRCLEESIERNLPEHRGTQNLSSSSEEVIRLIQLGHQATDEDYLKIGKELDHFSLKTLPELRPLVPIAIQDMIALQWIGDEEELAQMYRWYLRGLPPEMAIRRVALERQTYEIPVAEKLPWEGQLQGIWDTFGNSSPYLQNTQLSFLSLGEQIDLGSVDGIELERENVETRVVEPKDVQSPQPIESHSAIVSPLDTLESMFLWPGLEEGSVSMPLTSPLEPLDQFPLDQFPLNQFPPLDPVDNRQQNQDNFVIDPPLSIDPLPPKDRSRQTLPSGDRVQQVISMIMHFSEEEKSALMYELVQFPDLTNKVLTAIAAQVKRH
jgi:ribonuclease HI